jgi:hypothetical protein
VGAALPVRFVFGAERIVVSAGAAAGASAVVPASAPMASMLAGATGFAAL